MLKSTKKLIEIFLPIFPRTRCLDAENFRRIYKKFNSERKGLEKMKFNSKIWKDRMCLPKKIEPIYVPENISLFYKKIGVYIR